MTTRSRSCANFIAREFLNGKDEGLDATTPLIEWGVIDSIAIVSLRDFVSTRFGVEIPHSELKPSNLSQPDDDRVADLERLRPTS